MKKLILVNILAIVLIIFTGELLLRAFLNITVHGISKGIINYENKPVFNYPNIKDKKAFGKIIYTNPNGYRIMKIKNKKKEGRKNIYFVGGSVTFGKGVEQANTFTGILNNEIKQYNIINAGVVGSNLENNIEIIKKKIKKNNLKNIYVNFSLDDLSVIDEIINLKKEDTNKATTMLAKLRKNEILVYINNFIRTKSVIYIMLKGYIFKTDKIYYKQALNLYKDNDKIKNFNVLMNEVSNQNLDNKIVFIMIPYSYQINEQNCKKNDFAEKLIIEGIEKKNIKLIKLKEVFCNDKNKQKIFFKFDPSHLSHYGHNLVAKTLKQKIN